MGSTSATNESTGEAQVAHYVFGFGSLLLPESAKRTVGDDLITDTARAVRVKGFYRSWGTRGPMFTALASHRQEEGSINGLLFRVKDAEALKKLDIREMRYTRTEIPWTDISVFECHAHLDKPWEDEQLPAKAWIYVYDNDPLLPSEDAPLISSYMDVCIAGALRISPRFTAEFIRDTWTWTHRISQLPKNDEWEDDMPEATQQQQSPAPRKLVWVDDRSKPRYVRFEAPPIIDHGEIDKALEESLGESLSTLRITIDDWHRQEAESRRILTALLGNKIKEIADKGRALGDGAAGANGGDPDELDEFNDEEGSGN